MDDEFFAMNGRHPDIIYILPLAWPRITMVLGRLGHHHYHHHVMLFIGKYAVSHENNYKVYWSVSDLCMEISLSSRLNNFIQ